MTYVEFFEKDAVENICSALAGAPDRVVLIGHNGRDLEKSAEVYEALFRKWGKRVSFRWLTVNRNDVSEILETLSAVVEEEEEYIFDLTGGEELYLVAVGMLKERFPEKIHMHRINIASGRIYDCDSDGCTSAETVQWGISVEDNVRLYGGEVVYDETRPGTTHRWDMNEEFLDDIQQMWDICRSNVREWNAICNVLAAAMEVREETPDPLMLMAQVSMVQGMVDAFCVSTLQSEEILKKLQKAGLLVSFSLSGDYLVVTFKDLQIQNCLTKAGRLLELKIYMEMSSAQNKGGTNCYDDVQSGVFIDWDGMTGSGEGGVDTENEIDVIGMRGLIPVFVSCKNGKIETEELYKLKTVANRFGGKYAKMALIATSLRGRSNEAHLRLRAKDMGIQILDDEILEMEPVELQKRLRSL